MKMKELQTLDEVSLRKRLAIFREQARDLRFRIHSKEVKNNHQLNQVRKDIARILTLLRQKNV